MKVSTIVLVLIAAAPSVDAWERLVTQAGIEIEGDVTQAEFVLKDASGGEVAIPRAAIERLEATEGGLTATIKDGTKVVGTLEGKFEIEDGMIRRRYTSSEIKRVDFDQYIDVKPGKQYHSCPIRIDASAGELLFGESSGFSVAWPRAVTCRDLRIANLAYSRKGKLKPGKETGVSAEFSLMVPPGNDQLVDLSLQLIQGDRLVARGRQRVTVDEGEVSTISVQLQVAGQKLEPLGPDPRFRIQLVSQDASQEVERGGFFWWFTFPIPF